MMFSDTKHVVITGVLFLQQLFRRVAAALPGMESTSDKQNKDDLIEVRLKDTPPEPQPQSGGCVC